MIYIATNSTDNGTDLLETIQNTDIADIAGVPHLVALGEIAGKPIVPTGVGVAKDSYSFHFK